MKLPIEWLKEYVNTSKTPGEIADSFTAIGLMLDKPIENNVLNLEHRMDRSDWLSIIGCARDFAAYENLKLKYPPTHTQEGKPNGGIKIKVECAQHVNRFNTRVIRNVKVTESPDWIKKRLELYGIPSVNNIVDITNYVMVEFGQPMHAQDIDKMEKPEITLRMAKQVEAIQTLLGEIVQLDKDTLVLAQGNTPTVIGGIVGGRATAVDTTTKNIVLDAGNYNQTQIRRTSRKLKIFNETVSRYDKFLHPELASVAMERAVYLILQNAGGEYFENEDYYPTEWKPKEKTLRFSRIKKLANINIQHQKIKNILELLEYKLIKESEDYLKVEVPYFRTDVEVEDDLVADILRINGYARVTSKPISTPPPKDITLDIIKTQEKVRDILVNCGLDEHTTDPLVQYDGNNSKVKLENSLNAYKNALRTSIYQTLNPILKTYKKHKIKKPKIFEIGKTYFIKGSKHTEQNTLGVLFNTDYLELKGVIEVLLTKLNYPVAAFEQTTPGTIAIKIKDKSVGRIESTEHWYAEINLDALERVQTLPSHNIETKVPFIYTEDINLVTRKDILYQDIIAEISKLKVNEPNRLKAEFVEEYEDKVLEARDKKSYLIRLNYINPNVPVSKEDFEPVKETLLKNLKTNLGIELRA